MNDMTAKAQPAPDLLAEFLTEQEAKGFLRFLTCGSVDDGKSTLIGRLLYDTKLLFEDQLATLERDSKKYGTAGDDIDFALLVDGLEAEHQQGITIDVAYRFFSTPKRKFIVADTPGHEQYTRNMATGASTADLAVILIDARKGVLTQTLRHSCIVSLLGIRHVVLAINKMDLVDFSKDRFDEILADYQPFAARFQFESLLAVPLSARYGDNVTGKSERTPWYDGPSLIDYLDTIEVESTRIHGPLRMPVQWVNRPHLDFRGFSGTIASGRVKPGDKVVVARSGRASTVKRIVAMSGDLDEAVAGDAVTLTLADEVDISRGDCIAAADHRPTVADQFAAHLLWMSEDALIPSRSYLIKCAGQTVNATVSELKYRLDINNFDHIAAKTLELNEVGFANLSLAHPIAFDPYAEIRDMGAFILVDRFTNQTVGAGMIDFALRRASNIHMQMLDVDKSLRGHALRQRPAILWFTGLSGAGKSTIANIVEKKLHAMGHATYVLDGDNVRHGLNRDLGFTDADRVENIRRVAEVAKLMTDAGLVTLVSFISPFRAERRMARELVEDGEFIEIYVSTPLKLAEERDPKGLYKKARAGEIKHFTGIDSPYEEPEIAEMVLDTAVSSANELADDVITWLRNRGYLH